MRLALATQRRIAWWVFAACVVMVGVSVPIENSGPASTSAGTWGLSGHVVDVLFVLTVFMFPVAGILIVRRQPANRVGAILLAIGFVWCLTFVADSYARYGLLLHPGSLPAADVVAALNEPSWVPGIGLMGTFLILLFPDGRLLSPRWRRATWASGITIIAVCVATIIAPGKLTESPVPTLQNPLGVDWAEPLGVVLVAFPLCIVGSAVSLVLRFRRSRGVERLQLKWLASAVAFVASAFFVTLVATLLVPDGGEFHTWLRVLQTGTDLSWVVIPAAIGVAILKHGLYGIDVVINKTVVFGTLAAFITGVYVAIVVGVGAAVGQGNHSLALSIAATAIVAIAFQPVRERVQRLADRLVYGARATPYEVLSDFAARMGGSYESTDLLPRMARTIGEGIGSARVEVWLRIGTHLAMEAAWPEPDQAPEPRPMPGAELPPLAGDRVAPVRHHGEVLGAIAVTKNPGEPITPTEDKLLDDVASQAGLVLRNVRLIEELRNSRERLIRSQDDERRRLERNLHDGAQQSLVSVAVMLTITQNQLGDDPDRIAPALDEAADQLKTAIDELRELARGIHPAILTERGLGPAISSLADRCRVAVTVHCAITDRLPAPLEATVYFVVAEALTNVAKYAHASSATITVERSDDELIVTIADDGIGGADATKGSGLIGLADRVAAVDGHLDVHSPLHEGTRLTCRIPVATESPANTTGGAADPALVGAQS